MRAVIGLLLCCGLAHAEDKKCVVEKPKAAPVVRAKAAPCHRASKAIEKAITAKIAKQFLPEQGGKPEVKFPCDGLGKNITEIVIEDGGGHGGSLDLWRAIRKTDGSYDAHGILYRGSSMTYRQVDPPHEQASGSAKVDLDTVRAAMTAQVREVLPPVKKGQTRSITAWSSSRDFHVVLRLVDDEGRVLEHRYTGYASASGQETYLGLEVAVEALAPLTSLPPNDKPPDQDDKTFFAAAFNAAVPHFDDEYFWWVMERYVDLARYLGTPPVVAGLLTRMTVTTDDRSKIDARADAVDALAKITGWDARKTTKTIEEAAAAYVAACK